MIPAKTRYETHDGELLAIVEAFKTWKYYLKGSQHEVLVLIDHNNLRRFIDMNVILWHVIGSRNLNHLDLMQPPDVQPPRYRITSWRLTFQWPSQYGVTSGAWRSRLGPISIVTISEARLLKCIFIFDLFYHSSNDNSQEELSDLWRSDFSSGIQGNKELGWGRKF